MAWFYEVRYWFNGIRRCDIYLTPKSADRAAAGIRKVTAPTNGAVEVTYACSTWDPEKHYRELRKKKGGE